MSDFAEEVYIFDDFRAGGDHVFEELPPLVLGDRAGRELSPQEHGHPLAEPLELKSSIPRQWPGEEVVQRV
jgi:hypothetical protein